MVACTYSQYDTIGSPIRVTQRSGRTGRKRDGRAVTLITPGWEENVHERQLNKIKAMRKAVSSAHFEYYAPPKRLVPTDGLVHDH